MKTWNIGVIGAGLIADFHAMALNDIENANLVGYYDVVAENAKKLAEKHSCRAFDSEEDMLKCDEIDIIAIATPSGVHMESVIAAAQAGKHVICEKPLEVTLERIDAMIAAHEKTGTQLGGIFPMRYSDFIAPMRKAIKAGRFGRISYCGVYVPWWRTDQYYDSWHGTWKLDGGGALINQSIHSIDTMIDLMGPVESVQAYTATIAHPQIETEDTATAVLKFTNGALGVIYGSTASFPGQPRRFEITGDKGTVSLIGDAFPVWQFAEEIPDDDEVRAKFGGASGTSGGVSDPAAISYEGHTRNFKDFIAALEKGEKFAIDGKEARRAVELILAIYQSSREQKLIKLG